MLGRVGFFLLSESGIKFSSNQGRSILALFLIVAFCYNALPPNFFFDGNSPSGESGSVVKQAFWFGVFLLVISAKPVFRELKSSVAFYVWPLVALCLLMLMSAIWSLDSFITLRRSILQCVVVFSVLLSIFWLPRTDQVFFIIYRVASIVLVLNLFMLLRHNGFDEAGLFRGIHPHKNVVGYLGAISVIVGFWVRRSGSLTSFRWNNFYIFFWGVLLALAFSKTSIALALVAPLVALSFWRFSRLVKVGLWVPIVVLIGFVYAVFAVAFISGVDVSRVLTEWIDGVGFTGRDEIWKFLVSRLSDNIWLGYGYGGFWDIGLKSPNLIYGTGYVPMINQAHNGYLDILLNLGVLGVVAYLAILGTFFFAVPNRKTKHDNVYLLCWCLLVFSLFHNLTESSIMRGYAFVWVVQLIALAVTYRLATEEEKSA
ncbi:O-antigen ligase family protein [Macromonas nakdongensis]|uniref:O-antigen ligase family protein n=1 Tax=Macromonas nakdongensis TaxID=1843082 RepID=UPI000C34A283|nr:O-antigen ligase family protein [Macromonas nakdongensis]